MLPRDSGIKILKSSFYIIQGKQDKDISTDFHGCKRKRRPEGRLFYEG